MPLSHVETRAQKTTEIRTEKIKNQNLLRYAQRHDNRSDDRIGKSVSLNVDPERTFLNQTIAQDMDKSMYRYIMERVTGKKLTEQEALAIKFPNDVHYADGKKVRSDAVLAFEVKASYPGDLIWSKFDENHKVVPVGPDEVIDEDSIKNNHYFKMPKDMDEFNEWVKRSQQFFEDNYGAKNVFAMQVHLDEAHPHIHALVTPLYEDKKGITRLSAYRIMGGLSGKMSLTRDLQTEYAERFDDMGYVRGRKYSAIKYDWKTRDQRRAMAAEAISAELPKDRQAAEKAYRVLYSQYATQKMVAERTMSSGKTIEKQSKVMSDQRQQIQDLNEQLRQKDEQLRILRQMNRMREYEKKGIEMMPNPEDATFYVSIQKQLIQNGQEWYEKNLGIDHDQNDRELTEHDIDLAMNDNNK